MNEEKMVSEQEAGKLEEEQFGKVAGGNYNLMGRCKACNKEISPYIYYANDGYCYSCRPKSSGGAKGEW